VPSSSSASRFHEQVYSWLLTNAASSLDTMPGAEFRVAYEAAQEVRHGAPVLGSPDRSQPSEEIREADHQVIVHVQEEKTPGYPSWWLTCMCMGDGRRWGRMWCSATDLLL
jgi:hypothetical protein